MPKTWLWLLGATGILYLVKVVVVRVSKINEEQPRDYGAHLLTPIVENPVATACFALIISAFLVVGATIFRFDITYDDDFLKNVLVEAHGMVLDIAVIGVFILWLNKLGEKRLEIKRYLEEIDDFRGWRSEEAGYRIAGNVRRLNRHGVTKINLSQCDLRAPYLSGINLRGANLVGANLQRASLWETDLFGANLREATLIGADLRGAKLIGADLRGADLQGANLIWADLRGAKLQTVKNLIITQLFTVRSLVGASLDPELEKAIHQEDLDPPVL
jgi:BTB/POZ domain-containing protein KCTD9